LYKLDFRLRSISYQFVIVDTSKNAPRGKEIIKICYYILINIIIFIIYVIDIAYKIIIRIIF